MPTPPPTSASPASDTGLPTRAVSGRGLNPAWIAIGVPALLLAVAAVVRLMVGHGFALPESGAIWELRGFRVVSAAIVGAGLSGAGVMLQSLLRNPLASPDLIGVAAGSALGVLIAVLVSGSALAPMEPRSALAALVGAGAALGLVYALSQRRGMIEPVSLVLIGVIVSILCGAVGQLIGHLVDPSGAAVARLMFGALNEDLTWSTLGIAGGVVLIGVVWGAWAGRAMDAASLGDDEARSVGVALGRLRLELFIVSGVLTAVSVSLAGLIGFVGLVCPHLVRLIGGPAHRPLVVGSALCGAALVVGADAVSKAVELPTGRLPIGVVTALIGGPVFILLIRREDRRF